MAPQGDQSKERQRFLGPVRVALLARTAVILGNAMGGEKHYQTAFHIFTPEVEAELLASPQFAALPPDVKARTIDEMRRGVAGRLPDVTEDTMPGELSNCIAGRVANLFNFHGANYVTDAACASLRRADWGGGTEVLGPARDGRVDYVVGIFVAWKPSAFKKDAWIPGSAEYRILRVSDGELAASGRLEGPADSEPVAAAAARNAESFGASLGARCLAVFEARIPGGKP